MERDFRVAFALEDDELPSSSEEESENSDESSTSDGGSSIASHLVLENQQKEIRDLLLVMLSVSRGKYKIIQIYHTLSCGTIETIDPSAFGFQAARKLSDERLPKSLQSSLIIENHANVNDSNAGHRRSSSFDCGQLSAYTMYSNDLSHSGR